MDPTLLHPFMAVPAVEPKTMDYEEWRGQVRSLCGRYSPATDGAPSGSAGFVARHWISRARGFTPGVPRATARWSLAGAVSNYTHSVPQTGTSGRGVRCWLMTWFYQKIAPEAAKKLRQSSRRADHDSCEPLTLSVRPKCG
jgi:hypothetical protein